MTFDLFPVPLQLTTGGDGAVADAPVAIRRVASLPAEGFTIAIEAGRIAIEHADANALRYAEQTLSQIRAQSGETLPGLRLRDQPDFPVRGFMLDVSRDRVPTRETLERLVGLLARCRINQLQLYTEHAFAYRDHEVVWRDASPITHEDVRWLDVLCRAEGIELVANQNAFGHMGRWLRHPEYRDRAEARDGWEVPGLGRHAPAVLAPTEDNARFALGLVRELMESFTSRRINIGCDETFELGLGRSRAEVEARGRGRVYLDHLKRLLRGLHDDGCEVLFWGDILRSEPALVSELPREDTVALAWHYEAPCDPSAFPPDLAEVMARFGMDGDSLRGFAAQVPPFAEAGLPFWVCPGTSSWNSLVGRFENARRNLLDAAETGLARGAGGLLLTDWGDNGHLQPPCVSDPPLVFGAALAWGVARHRDLAVERVLDEQVYGDPSRQLGSILTEVGDAYLRTGQTAFNASPLFGALVVEATVLRFGALDASATRALAEQLDDAARRTALARPACADGALVVRELRQAIRLARHGALRLLRESGAAEPDDATLRRELGDLIAEQRACWISRSRSGGLSDSVGRLEATLASYGG